MDFVFHPAVLEYFPNYDYRSPRGQREVICDMRNPGNMVGHQQRAFSVWWALKCCSPLDLGLDIGSHRGLTPYCIHVDKFGDGKTHPFYGGSYVADVVASGEAMESVFPRNAFPFINSNHSIEHIPGDTVSILKSWLSLLRPGGILAMVVPDNAHFDVLASDADHKHAWTAAEFRDRVLSGLAEAEILEYDTLKNNFSFNAVLRRI